MFLSSMRQLMMVIAASFLMTSNVQAANKSLSGVKTIKIELVDDYGVDGDFVESQAFGYLAIRSYLRLPITFKSTTGCKEVLGCTGGVLVKNY